MSIFMKCIGLCISFIQFLSGIKVILAFYFLEEIVFFVKCLVEFSREII